MVNSASCHSVPLLSGGVPPVCRVLCVSRQSFSPCCCMLGAGVLVRLCSLVRLRPQWPCAPVSLHFLGGRVFRLCCCAPVRVHVALMNRYGLTVRKGRLEFLSRGVSVWSPAARSLSAGTRPFSFLRIQFPCRCPGSLLHVRDAALRSSQKNVFPMNRGLG